MVRPFTFPIPRCNDAVKDIDLEARYFISINMDLGYWQIPAEEEVRSQLAFFTPEGKKHWMVMPMGVLNLAPTFISMMLAFQEHWNGLAKE